MPKPYSTDLRKRVVDAREAGESPEVVALRFSVSARTVFNWMNLRRETGGITARPGTPGPKPILADHAQTLRALVREKPDATLEELRGRLPVRVCIATLFNMLRRLGLSFKSHPRRGTATC